METLGLVIGIGCAIVAANVTNAGGLDKALIMAIGGASGVGIGYALKKLRG